MKDFPIWPVLIGVGLFILYQKGGLAIIGLCPPGQVLGTDMFPFCHAPYAPVAQGSAPIVLMANQTINPGPWQIGLTSCPTGTVWNPNGGFAGGGACLPPGAVS